MIDIGLLPENFHAAGCSFIWFSYQNAQQEVPLIHRAGAVPLPPQGEVFSFAKTPRGAGRLGGISQPDEIIRDSGSA
jgi:hypothetical protein